jgi:hypothetical protein
MTQRLRSLLTDTRLLAVGMIGIILFAVLQNTVTPPWSDQKSSYGQSWDTDLLRTWLDRGGYNVRELISDPFVTANLDVIFIFDSGMTYTQPQANELRDWVRAGHTLVVAGPVSSITQPYSVDFGYLYYTAAQTKLSAPTLVSPPLGQVTLENALWGIYSSRTDLAVHLFYNDVPVLVSFPEGKGMVWVMGTSWPFTNRGLQDETNARLILNLLSQAPADARVGFDEAAAGHEDLIDEPLSLTDWLFSTPAGLSIVIGFVLTMTYLIMRGRRFGQPIPLPEDRLQREPTEYVRAMANLLRLSGQQNEILKHYKTQLKRELARRYALEADLPDEQMIRAVMALDPGIDAAGLVELFTQLSRKRMRQQDLVKTALSVDEWIRKLN